MRHWRVWLTGFGLLPTALFAGSLGVSWDNDVFVGSDRFYTNGVRLSWVSAGHGQCDQRRTVTCKVARGVQWLPGVQVQDNDYALTVSLEQIMITPGDIERSEPDFSDVPYVGYSNLELGLFQWDQRRLLGYGVRLGIVGKDSGAEWGQKVVHNLIGSDTPRGWEHQLGQDWVGGAFLLQSWRQRRQLDDGRQWDLIGFWSLEANTFLATAGGGGFLRYGENLPGNFIPDYTGIGTAGSQVNLFAPDRQRWGWEVFTGVAVDYIGYAYMESNSGPFNVKARYGRGTAIVGTGLHQRRLSLMFTVQGGSSPFQGTHRPVGFGNLALVFRY